MHRHLDLDHSQYHTVEFVYLIVRFSTCLYTTLCCLVYCLQDTLLLTGAPTTANAERQHGLPPLWLQGVPLSHSTGTPRGLLPFCNAGREPGTCDTLHSTVQYHTRTAQYSKRNSAS